MKTAEVTDDVIHATEEHLSEKGKESSRSDVFPAGSILVALYGQGQTRGRTALLGLPAATNQACAVILPTKKANQRFLWWCLRVSYVPLRDLGRGGSQPNLNLEMIRSFNIPVPPLAKQERIAAILDKADAIRRKRHEGIRLTEELLRSTFLEMFGDPGKNPKGWEFMPVSEIVAEMEGGKSILADSAESESTQHRVLKVSAVTWADYRPHESKPVPADYVPPSAHIVKKGDLIFSRSNTTELVGATVYVFDTPPNHLLSDKLWRFVWRDDLAIDPQYIRVLFMTSAIKRELGKRATGTSGSMKNISKAKLMAISIPVPPVGLQRKFGKFALAQHKTLTTRQEGAEATAALFGSLVQRAFRGEL